MEACSTVFHLSWKKRIPAQFSLFLASPCEKQSVGGATYYYFFKFIHLFFSGFTLRKTWRGRRACTSRLREARNVSQRPHNRPPSL